MSKNFEKIEDVLADDLFIAWFSREDELKVKEWENWIAANPQYQHLAGQATEFMNSLPVDEKRVPAEKIEAALRDLNTRLDQTEETPVLPFTNTRSKRRWWMVAAAIAAVVIISSSLLLFDFSPKKSAYVTPYGQLEKHELPDGSVVTLNANSSVKLGSQWGEENDREVWLNGEAFFKVSKTKKKNRFIVHTGQLDVIVTGTQFNVVNRNNRTSVLLTEGSVTILTKDGKKIMMKPGDFVELNNNDLVQKNDVNAENIIAWTDKKLVFEDTPMEKAAETIKDLYGVEVELSNQQAKDIVLTAVMPNDNLDVLLHAIEASMGCTISRDGNKIIITGKQ
jgi:transmembrane sensor